MVDEGYSMTPELMIQQRGNQSDGVDSRRAEERVEYEDTSFVRCGWMVGIRSD